MKDRYWSIIAILALLNYLVFSQLVVLVVESNKPAPTPTRTPKPTFTPTFTPSPIPPTPTPPPPPTPTATRVVPPTNTPTPEGGPTSAPPPEATATPVPGKVLPTATPRPPTATPQPVPPTAVPPTATPVPTTPPPTQQPAFQYTPTGWYGDTNPGLTRFMGHIKDTAGNLVNGVFVRAVCGSYSTISFPSGPVGWGPWGESSNWEAGFYDITVQNYPVLCMWTLQVVDTDDRVTVKAELSEAVITEVTNEKSVITADWQKNW